MVDTPRKTFPELQALPAPVVDSDVLAVYRSPGPAKRTTASVIADYFVKNAPAFLADAVGAVARTIQSKAQDTVSVFDFMTSAQIADVKARTLGLDVSAPIQAAATHALLTGKNVFFPAGNYLVGTQINAYASSYTGIFAKALRFFGEGMLATTITSTIANGYIFDFDTTDPHTVNARFILGLEISNMTLKQSGSPAVSGGLRVQACYHVLFENLHVDGFTGTGVKVLCEFGDLDGSVFVKTNNVRIENCLVWGLDASADAGFNEISYVACDNTFIQLCGVDAARAITGITKANPAVVTAAGHGYTNGDIVYLAGVGGMTEVNTRTSNAAYTVAGATTDTFQLSGINSTAYGTFTSGGHVLAANPTSGGMRWKGQVLSANNLAFTICENVSLYIRGQAGGAKDVTLENFTSENAVRIGVLMTGVANVKISMAQSYTSQASTGGRTAYFGYMLDGTSYAVTNVQIDQVHVRATSADTSFRQYQMVGQSADASSIRVNNTYWQAFGQAGQSRFSSNFRFDPVPMQCILRPTGATELRLAPDLNEPKGGSMPYRLGYSSLGTLTDGEWTPLVISAVSVSNSGLSANTTYNVYLYDALNVPTLELSTTGYAADIASGYPVKTGEPNKVFVGVTRTDGSSQFVLSGTNWQNALQIPNTYPGNPSWMWHSEADRKLRIKNGPSRPSSIEDGNYVYWPIFEYQTASFDPPSLAAGATATADITVTCSSTDFCAGIGFAPGWQGLTVTACVKTDNTVTVTMTNNTGGTLDLAASTIYALIIRR
jgi:hypothetical protein